MPSKSVYGLKSVKLPYLSGGLLKLFVSVVEGPLGALIVPGLLESAGIAWMRKQVIDESPTHDLVYHTGAPASKNAAVPESEWPHEAAAGSPGFRFATVFDTSKTSASTTRKSTRPPTVDTALSACSSSATSSRRAATTCRALRGFAARTQVWP